ncbi:hypothetical protein [Wolbachia endosymbiont (group B) of Idaea biselata]|uniref:hypothetical protein n=1 Tax=Wolbachia endosymbiont (group B) of Idaea biselata TaxID=3066179 RepID=UPI003132CE16
MSKNSQNLLQGTNSVIVSSNRQPIKTLDHITLKTGLDQNVQNLNKPVSGVVVKNTIDQLVDDINIKLIGSLNNNLGGLQKEDLVNLLAKVNDMLLEDAPTHLDIL